MWFVIRDDDVIAGEYTSPVAAELCATELRRRDGLVVIVVPDQPTD